jgi:hypothetical protein
MFPVFTAGNLENQNFRLLVNRCAVLDPAWHNHIITGFHLDHMVPELDPKPSSPDQEHLLTTVMMVPREHSLHLDDLDLLTVQRPDDLRSPQFGEQREFLVQAAPLHDKRSLLHRGPIAQ